MRAASRDGIRVGVMALAAACLAACLAPRVDLSSRAANPLTWYFQVPVGASGTLRGGLDLRSNGACLERAEGAAGRSWLLVYEPIGSTSLRTFAAGTEIANDAALLVAANQPSASVGFVVMGADGRVARATELALPSPVTMPTLVIRSNDGGIVSLVDPWKPGEPMPTVALVRVDSRGEVVWSTRLAAVTSVDAMIWSDAHGLALVGTGYDPQPDPLISMMVVARVSVAGELVWTREVRVTGPSVRAAFHPSIALTSSGAVQLAYSSETGSLEQGINLGVMRLDAAGSLLWSRMVLRPLLPHGPSSSGGQPWRSDFFAQAVATLDERAFVAATSPAATEGRSKLALLEIDERGTVTRQRAVPGYPAQFWAVRPSASNVLVLGERMTPCSFPTQGAASCGGPEENPGLTVVDHPAVEVRASDGRPSPGPTQTREVTLRQLL